MNDEDARTVKLPLDFLKEGATYQTKREGASRLARLIVSMHWSASARV
jgi:hypothetical protein